MPPVPALSTSWCSQRHQDGYPMLREMADLGFRKVELSHGIRISLVPGILKAVEEGLVQVGSVHNFCPLPMGVLQPAPNFFQPSSPDDREREQWLRQTKRSIDFAAQVGAGALVCHLGSRRYLWLEPSRKLDAYRRSHPDAVASGDKVYSALVEKTLLKERRRMEPYWQRTRDSISAVLEHAAAKGIRLGLENREKLEELPLDADFPDLLSSLPSQTAGYWHDVGHAHLKEGMGIIRHQAQLEANAARLIGFHLHDVDATGHDHHAIGTGSIDFNMVRSFWRPEHLFVIELSPRVTVEGVLGSKARVESLLSGIGE